MDGKLVLLQKKIEKCRLCRLCEKAIHGVAGEGSDHAEIMFIGEAPGRKEDEQGRPFIGQSGKFLTELLLLIGLKREDVFITSIVKHRPPENRDPLPDEIAACSRYLHAQIKIIKPKIIVTLGRHAMNQFLPGAKISEVHGKPKIAKGIGKNQQIYLPLYHPASALYNPKLRSTLMEDIKKIPIILKKLAKKDYNPNAPSSL